jgi:hypothetical protein
VRGALAHSDLLGAGNVTAPESLPRQRLFLVDGKPVGEDERLAWRKTLAQQGGLAEQAQQIGNVMGDVVMMALNPRQARERAKEMAARRARSRLYQKRDAVETALVAQLGKQATILREALRSQVDACAVALARANQEAGRMADRIDPRVPDGKPSTSMYYELETGAVGRDYLQHFYRRAASAVGNADWHASLAPLFGQLVHGMNALPPEQIYTHLTRVIGENGPLLERVKQSVDINHIISTQRSEEVERTRQRPDNRIHQWLDRLTPYIRWDADRFSFHESNLEHIRLAATPTSRQEDPEIAAATVGQEDIRWIPTGDHTRMDAVWIVHGLPVTLLERLDEFRAQYQNQLDFPIPQEFHLNPEWANLPEITLAQSPPVDLDAVLYPRPETTPTGVPRRRPIG